MDTTVAAYEGNDRSVLLIVFKQPGANVIDTVDTIKARLPMLTATIPPSVKVDTILDRTITIRASVVDVEFTLALSVMLVVLVILLSRSQFLGDHDSDRDGAARAARLLRGHLSARLQKPSDNLVPDDGADHRGRVRGRRRHRGGGEHLPPCRERRAAVRGSAHRRARDRLHGDLHQHVADRGVHPAPADGRHHRPPVPRIRHDGDGIDCGVGGGVAYACSDAGGALHAAPEPPARSRLQRARSLFRRPALRLSPHPRHRAQAPADRACRVLRHCRADHRDVRGNPQGLLPERGHRHDLRPVGGGPGRVSGGNDAASGDARRDHRARSGRRGVRVQHGQWRRRQHHQHRPRFHDPKAPRRAQGECRADHQPAASAARRRQGRDRVPAVAPGYYGRRTAFARRVPVHAPGRQHRRALKLVCQDA